MKAGQERGLPAVHQAVMQQLTSVVKAVPDVAQHHSERFSDWNGVPEVSIVLALTLLSQHVSILGVLGCDLLCQSLHKKYASLTSLRQDVTTTMINLPPHLNQGLTCTLHQECENMGVQGNASCTTSASKHVISECK